MQDHAAAIVDDPDLTADDRLAESLERSDFWTVLENATAARGSADRQVVIKTELAGFRTDSPAVTDPALVEHLIDLLHDRGFTNVAVVGAADSSALWAENRDLIALSDLLGYRFVTTKGRAYDIIDLAEQVEHGIFPIDTALHGCGLSRVWHEATFRIVFAKCRTDQDAGYALCLDTLIGVLPLTDKDLHYRRRRDAGDVVAALLRAAPVDFCLIDAVTSAHGAGGKRAPRPIRTDTIIAATDIVLADTVGALKIGLDPQVSPLYARVLRSHPLPRRYLVTGTLTAYPDWTNVPTMSMQATRARRNAEAIDRLVEPWLQVLDPTVFPLRQPLDARLNAALARRFGDSDAEAVNQWLNVTANAAIGIVGRSIRSYRTLFDKDALHQQAVPLGIDLDAIPDEAFDALLLELRQVAQVAHGAPRVDDALRWQYVDEAVVFSYVRTLPVDYDVFVRCIDIARTISFMNDYLGGVVVPLARDVDGRAIRQAERNIYLPQPNYLVLYDGKPIDVSKLEVIEYGSDCQRLYWKTVFSENASARYDDGIASFEREPDGTRVTIVGRQQFSLPPFWQIFDLNLVPDLKSALVTHAYRTFFDRTIANFEAMIEGRDIRIGKPVDEATPPPMEQVMPLLQRIGDAALPLVQQFARGQRADMATDAGHVDADGFVHVIPAQPAVQGEACEADRWASEIGRFLRGLSDAWRSDLGQSGPPA